MRYSPPNLSSLSKFVRRTIKTQKFFLSVFYKFLKCVQAPESIDEPEAVEESEIVEDTTPAAALTPGSIDVRSKPNL